MRFERKMETRAKRVTTGTSASGLTNVFAIIESTPRPDAQLFQRGRPNKEQTEKQFQRHNRIEVTAFALIQGKGAKSRYPLRFINKYQIEDALSLRPGDRIRIIQSEFSNKHGRRETELNVRDFTPCDHYQFMSISRVREPDLVIKNKTYAFAFWLTAA